MLLYGNSCRFSITINHCRALNWEISSSHTTGRKVSNSTLLTFRNMGFTTSFPSKRSRKRSGRLGSQNTAAEPDRASGVYINFIRRSTHFVVVMIDALTQQMAPPAHQYRKQNETLHNFVGFLQNSCRRPRHSELKKIEKK